MADDLADRISDGAVAVLELVPGEQRFADLSRFVLKGGASRFAPVVLDDEPVRYVLPVGVPGKKLDFGTLLIQNSRCALVWRTDQTRPYHAMITDLGPETTVKTSPATVRGDVWGRFDLRHPGTANMTFLVPPVASHALPRMLQRVLVEEPKAQQGTFETTPLPAAITEIEQPKPEPAPAPSVVAAPTPAPESTPAPSAPQLTPSPLAAAATPVPPPAPVQAPAAQPAAGGVAPDFAPTQVIPAIADQSAPTQVIPPVPATKPAGPSGPQHPATPAHSKWAPDARVDAPAAASSLSAGAPTAEVGAADRTEVLPATRADQLFRPAGRSAPEASPANPYTPVPPAHPGAPVEVRRDSTAVPAVSGSTNSWARDFLPGFGIGLLVVLLVGGGFILARYLGWLP